MNKTIVFLSVIAIFIGIMFGASALLKPEKVEEPITEAEPVIEEEPEDIIFIDDMGFPVDMTWEESENGEVFGTTVTTISSSDKMSDFPAIYNANLAAMNAGKLEISGGTMTGGLTMLTTTSTNATTTGHLYVAGSITANNGLIGQAESATSLASNPTNCSSGEAPLGVDEYGVVESCFDVWTESENTAAGYYAATNFNSDWDTRFIATSTWSGDLDVDGNATTTGSLDIGDNLYLGDDQKIYFDTAGTNYIAYDSNYTTFRIEVVGAAAVGLSASSSLQQSANAGNTGGGAWAPWIDINTDGRIQVVNTTGGTAANRHFTVNMTEGIRLITGGNTSIKEAHIRADNLTTERTFQFPDTAGVLLMATSSQNAVLGNTTSTNATSTILYISDSLTVNTAVSFPNDSITDAMINWGELTDLATGGVLSGDCVDESHIADNGIDSEHYNDDSIDDAHINWGAGANQISIADFSGNQVSGALVWDFGGATSVELPNGAAMTVDAAGEVAIDTTSGQLKWYDGTTTQIVTGTTSPAVNIASTTLDTLGISFSTGTSTFRLKNVPEPITLRGFYCKATSTGSVLVRFGDNTNWTAIGTCDNSGAFTETTSNNTWTKWEDFVVQIGGQDGDPNRVTITTVINKTAD